MSQPSGRKAVTCPLCGQRYTRTNFMYRGKLPVYSSDGRWLVDTHQISCYRRRTGKQPLPKPPARDPDAVQGDHEPADRQV